MDLFVRTLVILLLGAGANEAAAVDADLDSALDQVSAPSKAATKLAHQRLANDAMTSTLAAHLAVKIPSLTKTPSHFSLVIPSVVVHGFAIDKEVADQMPRKLDGGQTVVTPGVGLQYVSTSGFLMIGGVFKDCYDNLAGTAQIGQMFRLGSRTTFGYSAGIYARETPVACQTKMDRRGRKTTTCEEFDNYQLKWMTAINGESVDIIPMPFLHFAFALYKDRDVEVDLKIMSNFALNEFGLAIPF